jgi:hypothetical protein
MSRLDGQLFQMHLDAWFNPAGFSVLAQPSARDRSAVVPFDAYIGSEYFGPPKYELSSNATRLTHLILKADQCRSVFA